MALPANSGFTAPSLPDKSPQREMLATLNDVTLRVSYTALDGGPQFTKAVEELVDDAMKPKP